MLLKPVAGLYRSWPPAGEPIARLTRRRARRAREPAGVDGICPTALRAARRRDLGDRRQRAGAAGRAARDGPHGRHARGRAGLAGERQRRLGRSGCEAARRGWACPISPAQRRVWWVHGNYCHQHTTPGPRTGRRPPPSTPAQFAKRGAAPRTPPAAPRSAPGRAPRCAAPQQQAAERTPAMSAPVARTAEQVLRAQLAGQRDLEPGGVRVGDQRRRARRRSSHDSSPRPSLIAVSIRQPLTPASRAARDQLRRRQRPARHARGVGVGDRDDLRLAVDRDASGAQDRDGVLQRPRRPRGRA